MNESVPTMYQNGHHAVREDQNLFKLIHRGLRGRYHIGIIIGTALAAIGGVMGYLAVQPEYTAEGMVHVAPTVQKVLYSSEENELPPMFDSLVETEATFLQSRRVLEQASRDAELTGAGWPTGPAALAKLDRTIEVRRRRGNQIITIHAVHESPALAARAVNSVLRSYQAIYGDQTSLSMTSRERLLEQRQRELQRQIETHASAIRGLVEPYGTPTDLDALREATLKSLLEFRARVAEFDEVLVGRSVPDAGDGSNTILQAVQPDEEMLALKDPELADLVALRRTIQITLRSEAGKYGPQHRETKYLQQQLRQVEAQILERVEVVRSLTEAGLAPASAGQTELSVENITQQKARLEQLRDEAGVELSEIGRTMNEIQSHQNQLDFINRRLEETEMELEKIRVEAPNILERGRITLIEAAVPVEPSRDRRLPLAACGGLAGFGTPFVVLWLFSLVRPTLRYLDDLEHAGIPIAVLGTLPDLASGQGIDAELAALSVHQIRNTLSLPQTGEAGHGMVLGITSAAARDGKTSLLIALGVSFAAERRRTVLVDADLIGRGLSSTFGLREAPGLGAAIRSRDACDFVSPTDVPHLSVVPSGSLEQLRPEELTHRALQNLLDRLRETYDVVLVDTGPLMGSLEAGLVAALVDRTILVAHRGQSTEIVAAAVKRLSMLGATCAGVVFNRASVTDMRSESSQFSFTSQSARSACPDLTDDQSGELDSRVLVSSVLAQG